MHISKSAYMLWEFCPRAYKYTYIDGMRKPPTVSMQLGASFHEFAKLFFQILNYNALYYMENKDQVMKIFLETSSRIEASPGLENPIKNFLSFEADRFWNLKENTPELYDDPVRFYKPVIIEEYMSVPKVFEEYDDILLTGIIDRGDLTFRNSLALLEYKLSPTLNEQRLQKELMFYSILYEGAQKYEYPVTDLIAYTPISNDYLWIEMNEKKQAHVKKKILQMIEDTMFQCKENIFCADCVGAELCLDQDVDGDEIIELLKSTGMAYTATEITKKLGIRRSLVKAILSDLRIEGKVDVSFKGKLDYWWSV